jgi:ParB-like chromosome segregation protein Spo0J
MTNKTTGDADKVAEAQRLEKEGKSQRQIAAILGKPRHWVRYSLAASGAKDTSTSTVIDVPVHLIHANPHARGVDRVHVDRLAGSVTEIGLLEPIVVRSLGGEYEVMAGLHRVEAFRKLGRQTIPAIVREADDLLAELVLIDENLCRHDLSPAERSIAMKRRKAIYLQLHPETRPTADGGEGRHKETRRQLGDESVVERFTQATAKVTGIGERTIQRDAARGEKLGEDALKKVIGTSLDQGDELDALAKLSETKRDELISRALAGEAVTAKTAVKGEVRAAREVELAKKIAAGNLALPDKRYGVILADWPRKPRAWSDETGFDRAPDNHYATQTFRWAVDVLAPMIQRLAAPDATLVMWTTAASLIDDIEIMAEAGFCALRPRGQDGRLLRDENGEPLAAVSPGGGTYRSHQVWDKELRGTGRWFIDRHELVLVGVRGNIPCPAPGTQALSLFSSRRGAPSVKPDFVADEIDRLWPNLPKIELFARRARPGWDTWGADAPVDDATIGGVITAATALCPPPHTPDLDDSLPDVLRRGHAACGIGGDQ